MTTGSRVGPREAARLRPAMGFGDQSAYFRRNRNEERSNLRLGYHEPRPREKRKDRRANNSFKPTPFRCVACVRSLRSHTSPHRSRRGLTQALCGGHKRANLCWQSIAQPRPERRLRCDPGSPGLRPRIANSLGGAVRWPQRFAGLRRVIPPFLLSRA